MTIKTNEAIMLNNLQNQKQLKRKKQEFFSRIMILQCSQTVKLCDENLFELKIILDRFVNKILVQNFKFYSNLQLNSALLKTWPLFYRKIVNQ